MIAWIAAGMWAALCVPWIMSMMAQGVKPRDCAYPLLPLLLFALWQAPRGSSNRPTRRSRS